MVILEEQEFDPGRVHAFPRSVEEHRYMRSDQN